MTSTIMRNSRLPDDWLRQACAQNPIQPLEDRFLSGPVRFAFPSLFEAKPQTRDGGEVVHLFELTMLFPPVVDLSLPWNAASQMAAAKWPTCVLPDGRLVGVGLPFTSQDDKSIKYEGFTPGGWKLTARTKFKPRILDVNGNEITDPARVYPGAWGIVDFNFYSSTKKGNKINTSMNVVYLFADDTNLGGGGPDPSKGLAQVKAMAPVMGPPGVVSPQVAAQTYAPPGVPQTYQNAPNVAPPAAAPAYAPPAASYAAPAQNYAPVVETEEQRMLREAGLA